MGVAGTRTGGEQGDHGHAALVGLAFLLFVTADSFTLPFMPLYAATFLHGDGFLPRGLAQGAPISAFWLSVAAAQLTTGWWERGRERRGLFMLAMGLGAGGLALAGVAVNLPMLVGSRAVSGFGYGMVMIMAQDYMLRAMGRERRTFATGLYTSLFFGGYLFGSLFGSLAAEHLGYGRALLAAAGLTLVPMLSLWALPSFREPEAEHRVQFRGLLRNHALVGLVVFAAIPLRVLNGGFVYLLVPVYLAGLGQDPSTIGQVVMIFALVMACTAFLWSRLVDRTGRPLLATQAGLLLSGLAMLAIPLAGGGLWPTVAAMALLGTAQAIGMSPQITVLFRVAGAEVERFGQTSVIGLYRVCERVGLMAGPVLVGALLGSLGSGGTLLVLAGMMAACTAALALALRTRQGQKPIDRFQ